VFAHNGKLKGIKKRSLDHCWPIGGTDNKHAFFWILEELCRRFDKPPTRSTALYGALRELCEDFGGLGVLTVLLNDSQSLFAHCSTHLA
jgi:glutamine amidotransferase